TLAQRNHLVADFALLGLLARSRAPHGKELWQLTTTELVTKHAKCRWGVAEPSRRLGRGQPFQEVGPQPAGSEPRRHPRQIDALWPRQGRASRRRRQALRASQPQEPKINHDLAG